MQYRIEIHTHHGTHYGTPEDAAPTDETVEHLRGLLDSHAVWLERTDGYVVIPTREIRYVGIAQVNP
ncbi:hypothetical protein FZ103_00170 [Streptomonospora sp. PA3]|uniref:hypothetical protein n=1 Tax=Streptomonospora sp. PA3 TaxID=2607326 RepID=UPI0012DDD725|nr:hypothetical protein [Streptomonospora sp. PA3]MUL39609.1 hypothetical protein [Streptomonospora sp. PA3]